MRLTGNQIGLTGLGLLLLATALQFLNRVPAIVTGVALQWASIVFFVLAGVRRPRAWFFAPVALLCVIGILVWIER